jgi:ATP-binding cassette subfamily B multidrug efflux pump
MMTGRISDAYTNITTVKLFSHSNREAHARAAMEDFKHTGFRQMRLVSQFEIVNQALVVDHPQRAAMPCGCGTRAKSAPGRWRRSPPWRCVSMACRWIMWQMTSLFESIGTVQDGMATLTRGPKVQDAPDAPACW